LFFHNLNGSLWERSLKAKLWASKAGRLEIRQSTLKNKSLIKWGFIKAEDLINRVGGL